MAKVIKEIPYGGRTLTIETGEIARQATASVVVNLDGTVLLVTVVANKEAAQGRDFFPLTVNYMERSYAAGKIPGGFLRREGRPSEYETLIARLIDRPIRPLFPEGFYNEVQVIAKVMSLNPEVSPDIPAIIGASAVLAISGIPFNGPIAAARVGYKDGLYLLNPDPNQLAESQLNLVVAATEKAILMVESEVKELSEQTMAGALEYGHEMMKPVIKGINELAAEVGNPPWDWRAPVIAEELKQKVHDLAKDELNQAYLIRDKVERTERLQQIRANVEQQLLEAEKQDEDQTIDVDTVKSLIKKLEKNIVRNRVLDGEPRIDGRDTKTVRPIHIRTDVLPRTHGSALFTRGETQAIVVATLGTERDAQMIDALTGEHRDRFMLHYNFPPYCVGEIGMMLSPKRREIGHGRLARRSIEAVLPNAEDFPYVIRVVSEITESNGSSSMASVCGTSLALMDAGVPIKDPVAGIAMGLIKEDDRYTVLTDILGDEDNLGDMDFKVAGTLNGITALQMDIKIEGITSEIIKVALEQALQARKHILAQMIEAISKPREMISEHAPRIFKINISPDSIRDVIGKGGATIRSITEETGVTIDVGADGLIKFFSPDQKAADEAIRRVKEAIGELDVGKVYQGTVTRTVDFGVFVNVAPNKDGLVHISEVSDQPVKNIHEQFKRGESIAVKVLAVEPNGRIRLTIKGIEKGADQQQ